MVRANDNLDSFSADLLARVIVGIKGAPLGASVFNALRRRVAAERISRTSDVTGARQLDGIVYTRQAPNWRPNEGVGRDDGGPEQMVRIHPRSRPLRLTPNVLFTDGRFCSDMTQDIGKPHRGQLAGSVAIATAPAVVSVARNGRASAPPRGQRQRMSINRSPGNDPPTVNLAPTDPRYGVYD